MLRKTREVERIRIAEEEDDSAWFMSYECFFACFPLEIPLFVHKEDSTRC